MDPTYKKIGEYNGLAEVTDSTLLLASQNSQTYSLEAETVKDYIMESLDVDAVPTAESQHLARSGGIYSAIAEVDAKTVPDATLSIAGKAADAKAAGDAIGKAEATASLAGTVGVVKSTPFMWESGTINIQTGARTNSSNHLRTTNDPTITVRMVDNRTKIACDPNHKIAVALYRSLAVSQGAYLGTIDPYTGNLIKSDPGYDYFSQEVFLGADSEYYSQDCFFMVVVANLEGSAISKTDDFTVTVFEHTDKTLSKQGVAADARETGNKIGVIDIDVSRGTLISGKTIYSNNQIVTTSQGATTEISRNSDWSALAIDANSERATIVTFLTDSIADLRSGDSIDGILATGETGRRMINAGGSDRFVLPDDCTVIALTTKSSNNDHTPSYIAGISDHSAAWYAEYVVGKLPAKDIPAPPSSNGTYTLRATVSSGVVTYSWVSV